MTRTTCIAMALAFSAATIQAQTMTLYRPADIAWKPGPAAMPKGVQMAVLEGDPTQAGFFTMRLKFPAGTVVMPHTHSQIEHTTVMSGTLHLGMGTHYDRAATKAYGVGTFGFWLPGTPHFGYMDEETILQVHGQGPWTITFVNPADDPRQKTP